MTHTKENWKPGNLIYPLPAVMVSCGDHPDNYNILTVSWVGTICSDPAMCYISVRPSRHSYPIIKQSGEFVINLTTESLAKATDWCGVKSGREINKFEQLGLTPAPSALLKAPIILEAPISIECRVKQIIPLGTHDMFIAEVVNIQAEVSLMDPITGAFDLDKARLLVYSHGHYYRMGQEIGKFGWTVEKKKRK